MPTKSVGQESLNEVFSINSQFYRSVNLARDYNDRIDFLDTYQLTKTGLSILLKFFSSLEDTKDNLSRSWTITGPYGTGKSAFALYSTFAFCQKDLKARKSVFKKLSEKGNYEFSNIDLNKIESILPKPFCPVLVSGSRTSLSGSIIDALEKSINLYLTDFSLNTSILRRIKTIRSKIESGKQVNSTQIVDLLEDVSEQVSSDSSPVSGIFIVIDELGKFLEYAAKSPEQNDIFLLQELAEASNRSKENKLFLITILHQRFEHYASNLSKAEQQEWQKIQGRFEDVSFLEPIEELLRLIGSAIRRKKELSDKISQPVLKKAVEITELRPRAIDAKTFKLLIENCLPFHPITALLVGPLFRTRVFQNERSLFTFLNSHEAYGFQNFLQTAWDEKSAIPMYHIDIIYDYIVSVLGSGLYIQHSSKKWAIIETLLNRLPADSNILDVKLIKTIGMLGIVSEFTHLKASPDLISYDLSSQGYSENEVGEAIERLKHLSVVIYRRYNDTFSLWEGSDVDVESLISQAENRLEGAFSAAQALSKYSPARAIVARKHFFTTGTLRFFQPIYLAASEVSDFLTDFSDNSIEGDGIIVNIIPGSAEERDAVIQTVLDFHAGEKTRPILFILPKDINFILSPLKELRLYEWCLKNTPELDRDAIARKELLSRYNETQKILTQRVQNIYGLKYIGVSISELGCQFFYDGEELEFGSQKEFYRKLSVIFDNVYCKAPYIKNELINKNQLSSTTAAARRNLIELLLTNFSHESLNIQGFPPEKSIYISLLQRSKLHQPLKGTKAYCISSPEVGNDLKFDYVWKAFDNILEDRGIKIALDTLYKELKAPPYGLKEGPLPVLLCAYLLTNENSLALYEDGAFVPQITPAVFERLTKSPQKYELQFCRIAGIRATVYTKLLDLIQINPTGQVSEKNILTIVKPLCRFARELPDYTKNTSTVSNTAQEVRNILLKASDPNSLIFEQLPSVCKIESIHPDTATSEKDLEKFVTILKAALAELRLAYKSLLENIQAQITEAFDLPTDEEEAKKALARRSLAIERFTIDAKLKAFLIRAGHDDLPITDWLESIATFLVNKPPKSWIDQDITSFEIALLQIKQSFKRFESISLAYSSGEEPGKDFVFRVDITTPSKSEKSSVIRLDKNKVRQAQALQKQIETAFLADLKQKDIDTFLTALSKITEELITRKESESL